MQQGLADWAAVVESPRANIRPRDRGGLLAALAACGPLGDPVAMAPAILSSAAFGRVLELCPCLYAQIEWRVTARAIVHLCEITLGARITSANVYDAFRVQHPGLAGVPFAFPPLMPGAGGGDIMEMLCSEVLTNHGLPQMPVSDDGWPQWSAKGHLSLNLGRMRALKLYGDILIPAAPHNLLISVKSEAARERFVVSGNRLESVGFGFFNDASEFWTISRMNLLKRWGFSAVYMPAETLATLMEHLEQANTSSHAININGRPLYRQLDTFGDDMFNASGRLTLDL